MRVLVVEDEVRIVEILQEALSRSGFVVDTVRRCAEAREALSLTAYDAAILAAAQELGAHTVYSEDMSHGQKYDGVKVINPFHALAASS